MNSKLHLARDICMVRVNKDGTIAEVILHDWVNETHAGPSGAVWNMQRCTVCNLVVASNPPEETSDDRSILPRGH